MRLKNKIFLLVERLLSRFTERIVCISEAERRSAIYNKVCGTEKLTLIPNGIDIEAVRSAVPVRRSELGIADDAFVVGMIGRLSPQKAPDIFIHAAEIIHKEIPNMACIIVGDGEERADIEAYAEEHGLRLVVTGWTDEPYRYLKDFDVAMLLSRWEGFGLAIVEYMAAEKNVVATRIDAIPTLIDDGVDGLLTEPDNAEQAAEKVLWLYRHPQEAVAMRVRALRRVRADFDINRVINQHIDMFNKLMNLGGAANSLLFIVLTPPRLCEGERRAA